MNGARKKYEEFTRKGISEGRRPDLTINLNWWLEEIIENYNKCHQIKVEEERSDYSS